jgi:hypothetical protein
LRYHARNATERWERTGASWGGSRIGKQAKLVKEARFLAVPAQSPREVNRTVCLGEWGLVSVAERTVITPNENAADTLDVKRLTLEDLAHEVLGEGRVASPVLVWRLM